MWSPEPSFSKVIQGDFGSRIGSNLGNVFFQIIEGFLNKIISCNQGFQTFNSVWDLFDPKKITIILIPSEGWIQFVILKFGIRIAVIRHNVPSKTGIKLRWIRWTWILKHGIRKSGLICSRLHFLNNWAQGIEPSAENWFIGTKQNVVSSVGREVGVA